MIDKTIVVSARNDVELAVIDIALREDYKVIVNCSKVDVDKVDDLHDGDHKVEIDFHNDIRTADLTNIMNSEQILIYGDPNLYRYKYCSNKARIHAFEDEVHLNEYGMVTLKESLVTSNCTNIVYAVEKPTNKELFDFISFIRKLLTELKYYKSSQLKLF